MDAPGPSWAPMGPSASNIFLNAVSDNENSMDHVVVKQSESAEAFNQNITLNMDHVVKQSESSLAINENTALNMEYVVVKQSDSAEAITEPSFRNRDFPRVMQSDSVEAADLPEPSVLNRRLCENREYNAGNWNSVELRQMYDMIVKHGVGDGPLDCVSNATGRLRSDVSKKFEEINVINSENNEDRMDAQINAWIKNDVSLEKGGSSRNEKALGIGNIFTWTTAVQHVNLTRPGFQPNVPRKVIEEIMTTLPEPRKLTKVKLNTDHPELPLTYNQEADLNWERIYDFVGRMLTGQSHAVGKLNALGFDFSLICSKCFFKEAGIILEMLDDIEREAMEVTDCKEECAIIRGLLTKIYQKDFRDFEPEVPCTELTATSIYVDPLRTRKWRVPHGGSILTAEDISKYGGEDTAAEGREQSYVSGDEDGRSTAFSDDFSSQPASEVQHERVLSRQSDFEMEE